MHTRLIVVAGRQPSWVDEAFDNYAQRLPRQWKFRLDAVASVPRSKGADRASAVAAEGQRVLDRLGAGEQLVVLDERGSEISSIELAEKLSSWQASGRDLAFVIGGPDGISHTVTARADFRWSLSKLTLPHGLARILFVEQLYRAWTVSTAHPYHRA
ncbi:MAG: 23S rRNA (pseudouridine(1915)-N(3))-methyltransferase RlmH [Woeseia sp.]